MFDAPDSFGEAVDSVKKTAAEAYESTHQSEIGRQFKYLIGREDGKELARDHYGEDPEKADDVNKIAKETRDPNVIIDYLNSFGIAPDEIPTKQLLSINDTAHEIMKDKMRAGHTRSPDHITAMKLFTTLNSVPDIAKANFKKFKNEYFQLGIKGKIPELPYIPPYVAGLPRTMQLQIYQNHPNAFARSFPSSKLVKGNVLEKLLEKEGDPEFLSYGRTMDMTNDLVGQKRQMNILNNPNLSPQQLDEIATRLEYTKYNPNNPEAFEIMDRTIYFLVNHDNIEMNTLQRISDKFFLDVSPMTQIKIQQKWRQLNEAQNV